MIIIVIIAIVAIIINVMFLHGVIIPVRVFFYADYCATVLFIYLFRSFDDAGAISTRRRPYVVPGF